MAKKFSQFPFASSISPGDSVVGLKDGANTRFSFATVFSYMQNLFVPTSRKVNNKALTADITLDASDVGAVDTNDVGVADGVASLDSNGKVPGTQLDLSGKQSTITASGILKGDGAGGVSAATAGTDYQAPLTIDATPTASSTNPVQSGGVYDALGTKLSKAAVSLSSTNDLNDIVEPGWYRCTTTPSNAPSGNFQNAWFEVVANGSNILQFAYSNPSSSTGPTPKVRLRLNGAWEDWVSFDNNYPYANQSQLAYVESGTTASRNYEMEEWISWQGKLCKTDKGFSAGTTFYTTGGNKNLTEEESGGFNAVNRRQALINGNVIFEVSGRTAIFRSNDNAASSTDIRNTIIPQYYRPKGGVAIPISYYNGSSWVNDGRFLRVYSGAGNVIISNLLGGIDSTLTFTHSVFCATWTF